MGVKQCHKPPMAGNGKHTTYTNGDDWGMVNMALFDHVYSRWIWNLRDSSVWLFLKVQGMNAPPANGCQMPGGPAEKGCLCRMIGICSDDIHIFHQMISWSYHD